MRVTQEPQFDAVKLLTVARAIIFKKEKFMLKNISHLLLIFHLLHEQQV